MSWSNFESEEGRIISINMDEVVSVINYKNDKADILLKNGCMHTVTFIGPWEPEEQINADPEDELHPMNEVIQDLKLENARLQQREKLCQEFINFFDCYDRLCTRCSQYNPDGVVTCKLSLVKNRHDLINEFKKQLEDL